MIVSWNWLKEYVRLDMSVDTLTDRLMMAGLNLESVADVDGDLAVDLEVTSNRPDCLGHIGIAREVAVLFNRSCQLPPAAPPETGPAAASLTSVDIHNTDACPQYIARVIRGVKVGPSPAWMQRRLKTLGIRPINNIVDITNYVLMECGQPLHAFDFDKLHGRKIIVRDAVAGEKITAIDQREYPLQPGMCVIADADRPVAVAGVMGGLDTEISDGTTNVLIEVAEFAPMSVRATARKLNLFSDSSYRFERGLDRSQLDWASRRCCQLILELAGGELCADSVVAGQLVPPERAPIRFRFAQIQRILGIDIPREEVVRILTALGLKQLHAVGGALSDDAAISDIIEFIPPSWRRDLTREIDLIEESARVHGYDKIPDNVLVPLDVSTPPLRDRVNDRVTAVLRAAGFFETVTLSFVNEQLFQLFRPWTGSNGQPPAPLKLEHPRWQGENLLRQSLVPSLLHGRRQNERHGTFNAQLFEMARIYLSAEPNQPGSQPAVVAFVSGRSFPEMKGLVQALADAVNHDAVVTVRPVDLPQFTPGRGSEVLLNGQRWGWLGEIATEIRQQLDLQDPVVAAELDLAVLDTVADLSPRFRPLPTYPAIERDLNFVLDEAITWQELSDVVRQAAGTLLESVDFASQYRGPQIPPNKKSYVLRLQYRAPDRTLTADEVEAAQKAVITAVQEQLAAVQR